MNGVNFAMRSEQAELIDVEPLSFEDFRECLLDLARVSQLTLAYRPTLDFLDLLLPSARRLDRPLEVLDVGSGYGDMLREIAAWAQRRGLPVSLTGVDLNPWSRRAAVEATPPSRNITWVTADASIYEPPHGIDVVVSTLFTHHLPDRLVAKFLAWMEAKARIGWFVNDLHRHPLPYHFFRCFAKLASFHRFVQHDGPVSIARAFTTSDWRHLLAKAAINPAAVEVQWRMPFRLTVGRVRQP